MGGRRLRVAAAVTVLAVPLARSAEHGGPRSPFALRAAAISGAPGVGETVVLAVQTKTARCTTGPAPDRACSPGAYYRGLTKRRICSAGFRTSEIRHVTESAKHAVEIAYGMAPVSYGPALEIDHIVSLELGGSNEIANLFPEREDAHPGYRVKDRLENRLHDLVCAGEIRLRDAQRQLASDWRRLYRRVYGVAP